MVTHSICGQSVALVFADGAWPGMRMALLRGASGSALSVKPIFALWPCAWAGLQVARIFADDSLMPCLALRHPGFGFGRGPDQAS
jgi:hypothetical protein